MKAKCLDHRKSKSRFHLSSTSAPPDDARLIRLWQRQRRFAFLLNPFHRKGVWLMQLPSGWEEIGVEDVVADLLRFLEQSGALPISWPRLKRLEALAEGRASR